MPKKPGSLRRKPKKATFVVKNNMTDQGKVENALYWCSECIISGYTIKIWNKLFPN